MERENLAGDGKGKGTSGDNREAESTEHHCIAFWAPRARAREIIEEF
jgi:hypothetical protein